MLPRSKCRGVSLILMALVLLGLAASGARGSCPSLESCLSAFKNSVMNKRPSPEAVCSASRDFLTCSNDASAECDLRGEATYQGIMSQVQARLDQICTDAPNPSPTTPVPKIGDGCPALLLCREELSASLAKGGSQAERCRAQGQYLVCGRKAASTCSLLSHPSVAASLQDAQEQHRQLCPDSTDSPLDSVTDIAVAITTLDPDTMEVTPVTKDAPSRITRQAGFACPQFLACSKNLTAALQTGSLDAVCSALAKYVPCAEESKKQCPEAHLARFIEEAKQRLASTPACAQYVQPRVDESRGVSQTEPPMADQTYKPTSSPGRSISEQADQGYQRGCPAVETCHRKGTEELKKTNRDLKLICEKTVEMMSCMKMALSQCEPAPEEAKGIVKNIQNHFERSCANVRFGSPQTTAKTTIAVRGGGSDPSCLELERCLGSQSEAFDQKSLCRNLRKMKTCVLDVATRCSQLEVIQGSLNHLTQQEANVCGVRTAKAETTVPSTTTTTTTTTTTPKPTPPPVNTEIPESNANSQNRERAVSWSGMSSAPSCHMTSLLLVLLCSALAWLL